MATQYDTQLYDAISKLNYCKDSLLGFSSSFVLENDKENSAVHFLLESHAEALAKVSVDLLALFGTNKDKTTN